MSGTGISASFKYRSDRITMNYLECTYLFMECLRMLKRLVTMFQDKSAGSGKGLPMTSKLNKVKQIVANPNDCTSVRTNDQNRK